MPRFLSSEWLEFADEALRCEAGLLVEGSLTIQQVVTGGPGGDIEYHVIFDHGSGSIRAGRVDSPTVTFTIDYASAVAIGSGTASAQTEFMAGRLHLDGDASALLAHGEAMQRVGDVFASLRATTEF